MGPDVLAPARGCLVVGPLSGLATWALLVVLLSLVACAEPPTPNAVAPGSVQTCPTVRVDSQARTVCS